MNVLFEELSAPQRAGGVEAATRGLIACLAKEGVTVTRSFRDAAPADRIVPDCVHIHGIWSPTLARRFLAWRRRGIPCVVTIHGMLEPWALAHKPLKKKLAWNIYQKRLLNMASSLHATSEREAANLRKLGLKRPIAMIPWGVEVEGEEAGDQRSGGRGQEDEEVRDQRSGVGDQEDGEVRDQRSGVGDQEDGEVRDQRSGGRGQEDGEVRDQRSGGRGQEDGEVRDQRSGGRGQEDEEVRGRNSAGTNIEHRTSIVEHRTEEKRCESRFSYTETPAAQQNRKTESPTRRTALFVGRIYPVKGLPMLVEAWARLRPAGWRMRIVGPDEAGHLAEVQDLVRKAGLEAEFEFAGALEGEALRQAYENADLYIQPSHTENFGMAIAEAMSQRLPVITTHGAPWKLLEEEGCGWWVPVGVDGIAAALDDATRRSPEELRAMGERGRAVVSERFAWEGIARRFVECYQWLLGSGPLPDCVRQC